EPPGLRPIISTERDKNPASHLRDPREIAEDALVAANVPREDLPVIDTVLLRLPRVAEHQPPLEFVQIAADFFAPLASRFQMNGAGSAKSGRIVVLRAGGHADHDGFRVAADVNPVLQAQLCAGEPVERRADG